MYIEIKGASENNLKQIDLKLPKNKLIVFTGVSGSGKSTLAMETLQRECQRQYMESLGMTMNSGTRPKVKSITGLSPAISIHQHRSSSNPRSTVGTVTDIGPYMRVLFSKLGQLQCPYCQAPLTPTNELQVVQGEPDGEESIEDIAGGSSTQCSQCGNEILELTANHFSYNKPQGACPGCHGLGVIHSLDPKRIIDYSKSVKDFAIHGWDQVYVDRYGAALLKAGSHYGFEMAIDCPISAYDNIQLDLLLYGVTSSEFQIHFPEIKPPKTVLEGKFEGVMTNFMRRYSESRSENSSQKFEKFFSKQPCHHCKGSRYNKETLAVQVLNQNIVDVGNFSLTEVYQWLERIENQINQDIQWMINDLMIDLKMKIKRIMDIGMAYLTLGQPSSSLSAGDWQRIKLASVLGSSLTGVLYILDEPTSGLHPRDTLKVNQVLKQLRDMGNTVIVIEHNLEVIDAADFIVEFGPGAGKKGGEIVVSGQREIVLKNEQSIIAKLLNHPRIIRERPILQPSLQVLQIKNAQTHYLKNLNLDIPLGRLVCITGVTGSGKTSLVFGSLPSQAAHHTQIDRLVIVDQETIGRTSRSNPATYIDLFTDIRNVFATVPDTKLSAKCFSYNTPGGRCESCQGTGKKVVSMFFLPDIETLCPVCKGKRYQKEVLRILYQGYSIADVLEMNVEEALVVFEKEAKIVEKLKTLQDVGLGYLALGQSTATLSGGEAQRLKLAKELSASKESQVLYLLDEPLTGLHPYDCKKLIGILSRLVAQGNSVIVIEHHPEMIVEADWVVDLGSEGGKAGGSIVFQGTPQDLIHCADSHTGKCLGQKVK